MRNPICITFGAILLLFGNGPSAADGIDEVSQGKANTFTERLLERAGFNDLNKSYALVVGVSEFDEFNDLPTTQDPIRVRDYLIEEGNFDYVHLLTGDKVTKERLEELMLDDFRVRVGEKDRFLFYWSGHGETLVGTNNTRGFLPLKTSRKERYSSMVSMEDIGDWDSYLNAHQVLYLLDSCFSGLVGAAPQSDLADITRAQLSGPSRHVITAGRGNEQTIAIDQLGGSVFTNALLSGLRGAADAENALGKDNIVSLGELKNYIGPRVAKLSRDHGWQKTITPQLRDIIGSDGAFFFPVADAFPVVTSEPDPDPINRISEVQETLILLGYNPGPVNGRLTFQTSAALIQFQRKMSVAETGTIDTPTLQAFPRALANLAQPMGGATEIEAQPTTSLIVESQDNLTLQTEADTVDQTVTNPEIKPCEICPTLVSISDEFYMSTTEVTVEQFQYYAAETGLDFVDAKTTEGPSCFAWQDSSKLRKTAMAFNQPFENLAANLPVSCVSRDDAQEYIDWLNEKNGPPHFRFPTKSEFRSLLEKQTEFAKSKHPDQSWDTKLACVLGNFGDSSTKFPWRNIHCEDGQPDVAKVASFEPDANGIYDLAGNLWEWVGDCWPEHMNRTYNCGNGVLMGGSFDDPVKNTSSETSQYAPANRRQTNIGFRIVRDLE
jgi:formylglycine-generating enzyme required for sulfatase activity